MDRVSKAERELVRKMKKQSNADRIRAMTDEELAEWLEAHCYQYGWLDWLRKEAQ